MSHQNLADALESWEIHIRAEVIRHTWGHLAPKKDKTYKGRFVYAVGCFGSDPLNPTTISCEFKGLDSSPWFYDALNDFIQEQKNEEGLVYEISGTFRNYDFVGTRRVLLDSNKTPKVGVTYGELCARRDSIARELRNGKDLTDWKKQPKKNGWWLWLENGNSSPDMLLLCGDGQQVADDDTYSSVTGLVDKNDGFAFNYWEGSSTREMQGLWLFLSAT